MTLLLVCLSGGLQIVGTDLEKVVIAVLAMICDKKRLQIHNFAVLTPILA
jgi:hypothetical protein